MEYVRRLAWLVCMHMARGVEMVYRMLCCTGECCSYKVGGRTELFVLFDALLLPAGYYTEHCSPLPPWCSQK